MRLVTDKQYEEMMKWVESLKKVGVMTGLEEHLAIDLVNENEDLEKQLDRAKGLRWTAEARLSIERDMSRKLSNVIRKTYHHLLGNGSEEAERDMIDELDATLSEYFIHRDNERKKYVPVKDYLEMVEEEIEKHCNHINSVDNQEFLDCDQCNPTVESIKKQRWEQLKGLLKSGAKTQRILDLMEAIEKECLK
jgi:hypothetical protein